MIVARSGGGCVPRRGAIAADPHRRRRGARPRRLGDDRRLDAGRDLPAPDARRRSTIACRGTTSTSGGATTGSSRATIRSRTSSRFDDVLLGIGRREEGTAGADATGRAAPGRTTSIPSRPARRSARRAGPRGARPRLAGRAAGGRLPDDATAGRSSTSCSSGSAPDGHILSVFPGSPALDSPELALGDPGADPHRAARRARDPEPGGRRGRPARSWSWSTGAAKADVARGRPRRRRDPRRWPGPARPRATARPGSSTRRRPRTCPGDPGARATASRSARPDPTTAGARRRLADACRATYDFPLAHPDDEVRRWIAEEMLPTHEAWVAVGPRGRPGRRADARCPAR